MLSYLCGQFGITIMSLGTKEILAYVGVFNSALLAIFIWATAPVSGGFINPLITWTAMLCGQLPAAKGACVRSQPHFCSIRGVVCQEHTCRVR